MRYLLHHDKFKPEEKTDNFGQLAQNGCSLSWLGDGQLVWLQGLGGSSIDQFKVSVRSKLITHT